MKKPETKDSPWRAVGLVSAIGVELVVCTLAGFWGGKHLGGWLGFEPIGMVVGVLLGLAAGIVGIAFLIKLFTEG